MPARTPHRSWGSESALIVRSERAEEVAGHWRRRLDPSATAGIPAHITVLYPFRAPAEISVDEHAELRILFQQTEPIEYRLARLDWFDRRVLFIAVEPEDPFRRLTQSVAEAFPDCPPYRSAFESIVPHITVAEGSTLWRMRRASTQVGRALPIIDLASEVILMAPDGSGWDVVERYPLGNAHT